MRLVGLSYVFLDELIWNCGIVVRKLRSSDVFAREYCHACLRSNTFNSHNTMAVQRFFFHFTEVFSLTVEMKLKKIKKLIFLRQVVSLSGDFVSLEINLQRNCRFIGGLRSVWFMSTKALSGIVNSRVSFFQTICLHSKGTCSTWIGFTERFFYPNN